MTGGGGGTATPETDTSATGQDMYLYRPTDHYNESDPTTLVLYSHGYDGQPQHCVTNATHLAVTQAMLNAGWMVAASEMHGNRWGNQDQLDDLSDLYDWVSASYGVENVVLWGASMGGVATWNALKESTVTGTIGAVGSSPVCSLQDMYDNGYAGSIRTSYGIAVDGSDFTAKTAGYDPVVEPAATWDGLSMRAYASPDDTVVDKTANADALFAIADDEAAEAVVVEASGDHGDATNYPAAAIVSWIQSIGGV